MIDHATITVFYKGSLMSFPYKPGERFDIEENNIFHGKWMVVKIETRSMFPHDVAVTLNKIITVEEDKA